MKQALIIVGIVLVIFVAIHGFTAKYVPLTWRYCSTGYNSVCFNVDDKSKVLTRPDGCITNGDAIICGSYWSRRERW